MLVHLSNKSDSRMHLLMSKLFFFSAVISAVVSSMHGITFPRFVFFTLIHKRGSTLFPIFYLRVVCGSTVSLSLSLSLSNAQRRTHKPSFFFLRRVLSKVLSSLSLVHPITAKIILRCVVECKCGKCFLCKNSKEEDEEGGRLPKRAKKIAKIKKIKKRKKLPKRRFIPSQQIFHPNTTRISISNKASRRRRRTRERERTKENLYDGYAAILLRILRRVPHARFRDRPKTTHFRI